MDTYMRVPFLYDTASVYDVKEVNDSFATGSLKVMYLGANRNGSFFSKESVEGALATLYNVPIVAHWDEDAGTIGGHDLEVKRDDDGSLRLRNLTEPCGVVPDHARFRFVKEGDADGNEHEYLVIDGVILWKRQDVYKHIVDDLGGNVKHSMEISVSDGESTNNGYEIKQFSFTALCLLESCEPCFEGSELSLYSAMHFKSKMEEMMKELKACYSAVCSPKEEDDIHPQEFTTEGGEKVLEEEKIGMPGIEGAAEPTEEPEVFEEKELEEDPGEAEAEPEAEPEEEQPEEEQPEDTFALTKNLVEELRRMLGEETVEYECGYTCPRYWYVDSDFDKKEVYCHDEVDWLLYGFSYEINGDAVKIDYESKHRVKYEIVEFDGGEQPSMVAEIAAMFNERLEGHAALKEEYQSASDTIKSMEEELGELRKYKSDAEDAKAKDARDAVFAMFEDLVGIEAFDTLRDSCDGMGADEIEEKCYAIRGRNSSVTKFSAESKAPKQKIDRCQKDEDPYGDVFAKYGSEK